MTVGLTMVPLDDLVGEAETTGGAVPLGAVVVLTVTLEEDDEDEVQLTTHSARSVAQSKRLPVGGLVKQSELLVGQSQSSFGAMQPVGIVVSTYVSCENLDHAEGKI